MRSVQDISTSLAWTFTHTLPGSFKRNRPEQQHLDFPMLAPLPNRAASTLPMEGANAVGPFLYFVLDGNAKLCYIGKSKETHILKRWVRPGVGGPATHYWTHSTRGGGCVFKIADGLKTGEGPFSLRFTTLDQLRRQHGTALGLQGSGNDDFALEKAEMALIRLLQPTWNSQGQDNKRSSRPL